MKWYVGCSGFSYNDWTKTFYAEDLPKKQWLEYYATQFNTLELNVTFYRFPTQVMLRNFHDRTPDDFVFAAKVPRLITHYKSLIDCQSLMTDFYNTFREGLLNKGGPVLFQFPGKFTYSERALQLVLDIVSNEFTNVIEFRDVSWWRHDVTDIMAERNIVVSGASFPNLPESIPRSPKIIYYRFHGTPVLYSTEVKLPKLLNFLQSTYRQQAEEVYVYFNNTANESAIRDAYQLRDLTCD